MASEHALEIVVRRHVFTSERPFRAVLDGIFGGISQPDIGQLPTTTQPHPRSPNGSTTRCSASCAR
jgi:hypothetical protein